MNHVLKFALVLLLLICQGSLTAQSRLDCRRTDGGQVLDYRSAIRYREYSKETLISAAEWDKTVESAKRYIQNPHPEGFLDNGLTSKWKFIDVSEYLRPPTAVLVAVGLDGHIGHSFFANYQFTESRSLLQERIRRVDLKFYNELLQSESISIDSPSKALDVSLLMLKASTHRAAGLFIEMIDQPSDIPGPTDKGRRFGGIVREGNDAQSLEDFHKRVAGLSRVLTAPRYSMNGSHYYLSFFTWDPFNGDVERWCITVSPSTVKDIKRELIAHRL